MYAISSACLKLPPAAQINTNRKSSAQHATRIHDHCEGRGPVSSQHVSDKCASKRHLFSVRATGCSSKNLTRNTQLCATTTAEVNVTVNHVPLNPVTSSALPPPVSS
eukprot:6336073-Prorocentrum_lima.AAC.1